MAGLLDFPNFLQGLLGGQPPPQQMPQYQAPQPQGLYPGTSDPFSAATQNFVSSPTILGGINNAFRGATTGERTDPVGMYQQMRALTAHVLRQNGVPGPQADLAAIDPEAQKAVLGKLFPTYEAKNVGNTVYTHTPYSPNVNPQFTAPTVSNLGAGEVPSVTYPATPQIGGGAPRPAPIQGAPLAPPPGTPGPTPLGQGAPGVTAGTSTVLPAGPPMTLTQKAEQTKVGEGFASQYEAVQSAGQAAVKQLPTLQRLKQINDLAPQGASAPAYQHARSLLVALGVPSESVKAGEEFTGLANQLVLAAAGGKLGAGFSDADRSFMVNTAPNLAQTAAGRRQLIDTMEKVANRNVEMVQQANKWRREHNGTMEGFTEYAAQYGTEHPLFPGQAGKAAAPAVGPPVGAIHNGFRFKGGNPNDKANWEPAA